MVVPKKMLGPAVRITAVNACSLIRRQKTSANAYANRQSIINDILKDCKVHNSSLEAVLKSAFLGVVDKTWCAACPWMFLLLCVFRLLLIFDFWLFCFFLPFCLYIVPWKNQTKQNKTKQNCVFGFTSLLWDQVSLQGMKRGRKRKGKKHVILEKLQEQPFLPVWQQLVPFQKWPHLWLCWLHLL